MNPMYVPKVVKYFKSAVKSQQKKNNSTDCFFWLQYDKPEKPLIYLQLDDEVKTRKSDANFGRIAEKQVPVPRILLAESAKSLFNWFDEKDVSFLEFSMKFNLDTEIAEMMVEVSVLKKIDIDKMKVCIHEADGIMVANTYNGDTEISCDTLEDLLTADTGEDTEADEADETQEEPELETETENTDTDPKTENETTEITT